LHSKFLSEWISRALRHPVNSLELNEQQCTLNLILIPCILRIPNPFSQAGNSVQTAITPTSDSGTAHARTPFEFKSAAHLLFIERERASSIEELLKALQSCPEESIFQHTFRTLEEHHFIKEGFSNDFAHWAYTELGEVGLGERLASLDVREFTSLAALRARLVQVVDEFGSENPKARARTAAAPFYFCSSRTIVLQTQRNAANLIEFIEGLRQVSLHSIDYHFIEARLRRKLESNDFSIWLLRDLGMERESALLNHIDIYTSTLEGVRRKIIQILQNAIH
jgi:hypothetical protein